MRESWATVQFERLQFIFGQVLFAVQSWHGYQEMGQFAELFQKYDQDSNNVRQAVREACSGHASLA